MLLLAMTLVLIAPAYIARMVGGVSPRHDIGWRNGARIGITLLFLLTGIAHFIVTGPMSRMIPPPIPFKVELVYFTGICEILGAIGVWVPGYSRAAGAGLILLVAAVFPANIYTALSGVIIEGQQTSASYLLVRVPFEVLLVVWIYRATLSRALHARTDPTAPTAPAAPAAA